MLESVIEYMKAMQHTHYSGEAMFRIVRAVEQSATHWTKPLYLQWKKALSEVGIGRPGLIRLNFKLYLKRYPFLVKNH